MGTLNLARLLDDGATAWPEREAIVFPHPDGVVRLTYAQVDGLANQVANALVAAGIGPGDKVALTCPNTPYFSVVYFGILKAGAVVVPLNVLLKAREVAYHLTDSDARAYFCFEGVPGLPMGDEGLAGFGEAPGCELFVTITSDPLAASPYDGMPTLFGLIGAHPATFETAATDEDDTAVILYTSGTTGQPKGAELRHRNMYWTARISGELAEADPDDPGRILLVLPLFHSYGQTCVQNAALMYGGTSVLMPRFEAWGALELIRTERITGFSGVPTMFWGMLAALDEHPDYPVDEVTGHLERVGSGGAALPVEIHREWERRFGIVIQEGYGLSETSPTATFSPFGQPARPGSVGIPVPGVEMRLIEPGTWEEIAWSPDAVGEIAIKGPNVMKGYYRRPEATEGALSRDGWFRTGDLARRDEDGWYYIVDRAKDLIIRGGFNVYPREIEEVLMTHPAVSLAAVIGVPSEEYGEEVKAYVILKPGHEATAEELVDWSRGQMAAYKYPRVVEIATELPMTSTGKILKRALG